MIPSTVIPVHTGLSGRQSRLLAWTLFGLSLAFFCVALVLHFGLSGKGLDGAAEISFYFAMYTPIGAMIALNRPGNSIGWLYSGIGLATSVGFAARGFLSYSLLISHLTLPGTEVALVLDALLPNVSWPGVFLSLMLFPDGHFLSRRWRMVGMGLVFQAAALALAGLFSSATLWDKSYPNPFRFLRFPGAELLYSVLQNISIVVLLLCLVSLAVRFSRVRGEQRAQIKLFVFAASLLLPAIAMVLVTTIFPALNGGIISQVSGSLAYIWLTAMPLSIGLAILRYRLYDIDIIIRRTLLYGVLTALLAGIYFGGVVLLQALLRPLTGAGNDLAVVATTLLIAALVLPLRRLVQGFIDRRFYRRKYDAARTLAAFGRAARDEVDLNVLTGSLVGVVEETMQPAHISIWLRPVVDRRDQLV